VIEKYKNNKRWTFYGLYVLFDLEKRVTLKKRIIYLFCFPFNFQKLIDVLLKKVADSDKKEVSISVYIIKITVL